MLVLLFLPLSSWYTVFILVLLSALLSVHVCVIPSQWKEINCKGKYKKEVLSNNSGDVNMSNHKSLTYWVSQGSLEK